MAYLLNERTEFSSRLNIITYKTLKGVWNGKPYPVIWYYDSNKHNGVAFEESFTYSESIASEYANEYFRNKEQYSGGIPKYLIIDTNKAIGKVCSDLGLNDKIKNIKEIIQRPSRTSSGNNDFREDRLEMHFAAICCDVPKKRVLILKRAGREVMDAKWEFGCAKANAEDHIEEIIKKNYEQKFGLKIDLVKDLDRIEGEQIRPIALYEYTENENIHKGVIVVAEIQEGAEFIETFIKKTGRYNGVLWLSEANIDEFDEDSVPDLKDSIKKVFKNWDNFFKKEN